MSAQQVPAFSLDTSAVPADQRLDLWRRVIPSHSLEAVGDPTEFSARGRTWLLGQVLVTDSVLSPLRYRREQSHIAADKIDHLIIMLLKSGVATGDADGEPFAAGPGDIFLQDLSKPLTVEASDVDNLTIRIPRVDADFGGVKNLNGLRLTGPLARFLAEQLQSLVDRMDDADLAEATSLAEKVFALATAAIKAQLGIATIQRTLPVAKARLQARRYIDAHLTSDKLTPATIAKAIGVPRSTLYLAFDGGIATYIKRRRLDAAHVVLNDRNVKRSISDIAHDHGFATNAHFSRAFRAEYGYPPSEVRTGKANLFDVEVGESERADLFARWISRLDRN